VSAQTFTSLCSFSEAGGGDPITGVLLGSSLYGVDYLGGASGAGAVFEIGTDGSNYTVLYSFTNGLDGSAPASLIFISNRLCGTASGGGSGGSGTVFALDTNGGNFTVFHTFVATNASGLNSDGAFPSSVIGSGNNLYGTASIGGNGGNGTVFALNITSRAFTNLYSFTATDVRGVNSDGANPIGAPILSGNTLYGTTCQGGNSADGTIFSIQTDGSGFTNLHEFSGATDGAFIPGGLVLRGESLYGTAGYGGSAGNGTVFALATNGAGFTILHDFAALDTVGFNSDGAHPEATVVLSGNTLFGTTLEGGTSEGVYNVPGGGTAFAIRTDGSGLQNLHNFYFWTDGYYVWSSLLISGNTLYGTALGGGAKGYGTEFSIALDLSIGLSAIPTAGPAPLTVLFSAPNVDNYGETITNWNWSFGDGAMATAQNASQVYSTIGVFNPSLVATNDNGVAITALGPSIIVGSVLSNGGFETGDFSGWALSGDTSFVSVDQNQFSAGNESHLGLYSVALGTTSNLGYISQTLRTVPGKTYLLSLQLNSPDGLAPNEFRVNWNGKILFDQVNMGAIGWTNLQFLVKASGSKTVLEFGFRDDPSYLRLDDVFVGMPQLTISHSGTNVLLTCPAIASGLTVQCATNLDSSAVWSTVSSAPAVTNGQSTLSTPLSSSEMFYRLTQR